MARKLGRRDFLKRGAIAAGAVAGAALWRGPIILAGESPNAKVNIALIGCGGQGTGTHLPNAARQRLVAICDVDERRWAKGLENVAKKVPEAKIDAVKTYFDYRKMFDEMRKDIDAVFIATPNHHHALPAMIAMQLGKGVYVEKPMAHSIQECRALAAAARKHKVPTQMGNQGHCGEGYRRLCEYIWAGAIGKVTEVHAWSDRANGGSGPRPKTKPVPQGMHWDEWIGPAPYRDFHDDLHLHEWHGWYDFGNGSLGNMACHVMDGAVWALKLKHPTAIEAELIGGGTDERLPTTTRLRYDFPARGDMPPAKLYWYDGRRLPTKDTVPENVAKDRRYRPPLVYKLEKEYDRDLGGNGTLYVGDKGIMYSGCYGGGVRILPEEKHKAFPAPPKTLPRVKGGSFGDLVAAVRDGRVETGAPFEYSSVLTEIVVLGNLAQRAGVGRKVAWDGPNMKVTNLTDLNRYVTLQNRKGWTA